MLTHVIVIILSVLSVVVFVLGHLGESPPLVSLGAGGIVGLIVYGLMVEVTPWLVGLAVFFTVTFILLELTSR